MAERARLRQSRRHSEHRPRCSATSGVAGIRGRGGRHRPGAPDLGAARAGSGALSSNVPAKTRTTVTLAGRLGNWLSGRSYEPAADIAPNDAVHPTVESLVRL